MTTPTSLQKRRQLVPEAGVTGEAPRSHIAMAVALVLLSGVLANAVRAQQPATTSGAATTNPVATSEASQSLPALLARVLTRDPQVRVAQSLYDATGQRELQARSRFSPTVGISTTQGSAAEKEFSRNLQRRTDRIEATLRWNLYNGGGDVAELNASAREVTAAAHELRRAREEVSERIANAYAELLRVTQLLPRSQSRLDSVRELVRQVLRQNELGKASDADAQQALATLLDSEIMHAQLLSEEDGARRRLSTLAGEPIQAVLPIALPNDPTDDELATPLPGMVEAARERALAARERVRPIAQVLAPRVDFEYSHSLRDQTSPAVTTERKNGWQVVARWELPLGGELQARRAELDFRAAAAEAEADRILLGVSSELDALAPRIDNARRAVRQLDSQIARYDVLVRAGELQFEAGRRSLSQVVQLHDGRFSAQQRRSDQAYQQMTAQIRQLALSGKLLAVFDLAQP